MEKLGIQHMPERLQLLVDNPRPLGAGVRTANSVWMGCLGH